MPICRTRRSVIRALLGCGLCLAAALVGCGPDRRPFEAGGPVHYVSDPWEFRGEPGRKIRTQHYEIYTTVNEPDLLRLFPQMVEGFYDYYRHLVPSTRPPAQRMQVLFFADRDDWAAYTRAFTGEKARVFLRIRHGGYSERGVTVIQFVDRQTTGRLLGHEGLHQYLHHCVNTRVPAWLNEGLAVVCEGHRWTGGGVAEFDRWYNPPRRNLLAEMVLRERLTPLRELLAQNAGHVVGGSYRMIGRYYAQLWALMLFLEDGADGKYADAYRKMIDALGTADLDQYAAAAQIRHDRRLSYGEAVFAAFITDEFETFEAEYRAFLRDEFITR